MGEPVSQNTWELNKEIGGTRTALKSATERRVINKGSQLNKAPKRQLEMSGQLQTLHDNILVYISLQTGGAKNGGGMVKQ